MSRYIIPNIQKITSSSSQLLHLLNFVNLTVFGSKNMPVLHGFLGAAAPALARTTRFRLRQARCVQTARSRPSSSQTSSNGSVRTQRTVSRSPCRSMMQTPSVSPFWYGQTPQSVRGILPVWRQRFFISRRSATGAVPAWPLALSVLDPHAVCLSPCPRCRRAWA